MSIRNLSIMAVLAFSLSTGFALAQGNDALPFVKIVRDPVTSAMGFSGSASTSGIAYSSFRNSAVIPFSQKQADFGFSFQKWAPGGAGSSNANIGAAFKIGERFGLSFGGAYQTGDEYGLSDASGNSTGSFTPSDMLFNAGFGVLLMESLSVGANVRYAGQKLSDSDSYSAFAADVFVMYALADFKFTAGVSSIGSKVKASSGDSFSLPSSAAVGADYSKLLSKVHGIELALDADYFFSGDFTAALGACYSYNDTFFARAGYHFGADAAVLPSFVTLGAGVKFSGISLDLSFLTANKTIGNTVTIGAGYSF